MKKLIIAIFITVAATISLQAQETLKLQEDIRTQDTVKIAAPPVMDSSFYMKSIFSLLSEPGPASNRITVEQSKAIEGAFTAHIASAASKKMNGFRVRIYFDNSQYARSRSGDVSAQFASRFPAIQVYRTYTNPYFKVTVGDFRTKSDAMRMLKQIEAEFPSAFVVREQINFPPL